MTIASTPLTRLACGVPLLTHANRDVAVATADVWVRTGAADEPPEIAGVSHFLEHMMFKGTERFGLGEIERAIEAVGGVSNAATSYDFTHYYVTLPSSHVGLAIDMLAEMVGRSTLDAAELEKERLVILEEWRRKQDNPAGVLYELLYESFFAGGPYRTTVLGSEQTIRAIDRDRMMDYYRRRYSRDNLCLVVTGHFDREAIVGHAERAFADFTRPLDTLRPDPPAALGAQRRVHRERPTGGEVYLAFALPAPGMEDPGAVLALDVAQFVLGQGRASILYQTLKEKQGVCSSIGSHFPTHLRPSFFLVSATCRPDQRAALREALARELRRFAVEQPSGPAMERARRLLAAAHRFSMESSGGASGNLGYYYTMTGGTEFLDRYLDRLAAVTPAQVSETFARWTRPDALDETLYEVSVGPSGAGA
jgi:predicted Zn-dependent peptidase